MHRSDFSFEAVDTIENSVPNPDQLSIHAWLARTISRLGRQACCTETACQPSHIAGFYYITHGQTTHHLKAYETYRFLRSILWLYGVDEASA